MKAERRNRERDGEKARPEARVAHVYPRSERERERERGGGEREAGGNFKHLRPSNIRIIYDTRAPIKQSLNSFVYAGEARHVAALIYGRTSAACPGHYYLSRIKRR